MIVMCIVKNQDLQSGQALDPHQIRIPLRNQNLDTFLTLHSVHRARLLDNEKLSSGDRPSLSFNLLMSESYMMALSSFIMNQ